MSTISSSTSRNEIADQYATQQAEKEQLRAEHETEMERLNKNFAAEKESLKDRYETSLQQERLQTYENLRNTKKGYSKAERDLDSAGKERIRQKADELAQEEIRISKEGTAKVDEAIRKQAAIEEYQRAQANTAESMIRHNAARDAQTIIRDHENKLTKLQENRNEILEKRRADHGVAVNQIKEYYDKHQNQLITQHDQETQNIKKGIDDQINIANLEGSQRLKAHLEKAEDPFYRMTHIDSDFSDIGEFYQLRVRLPEHERKGFRVQISGQELQFSGMREANLTASLEPGHQATTKNYQSFSERYKFDSPVDANAMQVNHEDEWMVYTIPKWGARHRMREENVHSKISAADLEMSRDMEFKETLPVPKAVKEFRNKGNA